MGTRLVPPPPLLSDVIPNGVPERLINEAIQAKERVWSLRTHQDSQIRNVDADSSLPILPPDVNRDQFEKAIKELSSEIGSENIVLNDKPLLDGWYMENPNTHDAFHIYSAEDLVSSCAIYPGSTTEVQTIVRWANKYLIPLYPISMGRNLGYGGAAPRVRGSAILDLGKRMNKVLKIDPHNCSCLVEPGVSYYALYEEIQKAGYPLWIDTPDVGGGSVLGNAVDRGVGYTPYGDHFSKHCGMEVVLPSGEIVRLGMGALPGKDGEDNPCWQSFQYGYGPYNDGIFTQSNFGIVTKMGFWLMPATEHETFLITFPNDEDFSSIIDVLLPLSTSGVIGNVPQLRHSYQELAATGKLRDELWEGKGPMPRDILRKHMLESPFGDVAWIFYAAVYGASEARESSLSIIRKAFSAIPGSKFISSDELPDDHYARSRVHIQSGTPLLRELAWLNWRPNGSHLFFSPISPTTSVDAKRLYELISQHIQAAGFDFFPTFCIGPREMHLIVCLVYDRGDEDEKQRAVKCFRLMIDAAAREGYGEYRTHLLFSDQVAATYGWNNGALGKLNETIKDALDPNGILAPGKNGIWPKRFRGKGWEILSGDERMYSTPWHTIND